jgi:hypothetical protein
VALGDAVDRLEDRVDLELVGFLLLRGEAGAAGGGGEQALELGEQAGDFLQAAFGDVHDLVGAVGVADRGVDGLDLGAQVLAGDQAGGVVLAAVDAEARAQTLKRLSSGSVVLAQHALSDQRLDVRIDATHWRPP